jgi:hypothetical protein
MLRDIGISRLRSAAANIPAHRLLDTVVFGSLCLFNHPDRGHDPAGGAVTTMVFIMLDKSCLHGVETSSLSAPFNRLDLSILLHRRKGHAAIHASTIDLYRTSSTVRDRTLLRSCEMNHLSKSVQEIRARID